MSTLLTFHTLAFRSPSLLLTPPTVPSRSDRDVPPKTVWYLSQNSVVFESKHCGIWIETLWCFDSLITVFSSDTEVSEGEDCGIFFGSVR
jgi:hypothetical protein